MNCKDVLNKIDELQAHYLDVLETACNIESPTNFKEGVDKVAYYFADKAKEKGWKVEVLKQNEPGSETI